MLRVWGLAVLADDPDCIIPVSCDLQLAPFPHETNGEYLRAYKRITMKGGDCHRPCTLLLRVLGASVCAFPFCQRSVSSDNCLSSTGSKCSVEIRALCVHRQLSTLSQDCGSHQIQYVF